MRAIPENVLDLDRAVEGDVGEPLVHRAHDAPRVRRRVQEVGIAERDVSCAGRDQLRDVGEHRVLVEPADPAVEHHRHRAVSAAVRAPVRRQHRADEALLAADLEPGVAVEWRQQVAGRERGVPVDRGGEVGALVGIEPEAPHGAVDVRVAARSRARRVAVCIGHRERDLVGPRRRARGPRRRPRRRPRARRGRAARRWAAALPRLPRLLAELVGGHEEDAHRSRLGVDADRRARRARPAATASTSAGVSPRANRKPR